MQIISGKAYIVFTLDDGIVLRWSRTTQNDENLFYIPHPVYEPYEVHVNNVKRDMEFVTI